MSKNKIMSKKVTRKGSGRTKGSFSFVRVSLEELNAKFADKSQPIVVGRKFAEQCGFKNLVANPASNTYEAIQGLTPATKVAAKVTNFDD